MEDYEALFTFAAKAGALEGYLYEREQIEPLYDWIANLETMYANLPDKVKRQIKNELGNVLTRSLKYGGTALEEDMRARLDDLLSRL